MNRPEFIGSVSLALIPKAGQLFKQPTAEALHHSS